MSTINVGSLPVVDELFEDDMVLVQAKDRTGLLKFADLVVGEQQVSFYQEIVNARNSIAGVSQAVQQNTTNISTNAQLIEDLQDKTNSNSTSIQTIEQTATSLQDQTTNLQSSVSAVATLANSVLNESILRLNQSTASNQQLSTQYSTLTGNISNSLASMEQRVLGVEQQVEQLYTAINNINSTLYSQQEQINDLKNSSGSSSTGDGAAGDGAAGGGAAEDNKEWYEYLGTHESSLISNLIDSGMIDTSTRAAKHVNSLTGTMLEDSALVLRAADASVFSTSQKDGIEFQWYFIGVSDIFDQWLTDMRVKADAAIAAEAAEAAEAPAQTFTMVQTLGATPYSSNQFGQTASYVVLDSSGNQVLDLPGLFFAPYAIGEVNNNKSYDVNSIDAIDNSFSNGLPIWQDAFNRQTAEFQAYVAANS